MKFIHLSDLHIHSDPSDNNDVESVLDYVQKTYPEHRLIVTGDIVDDGHERQYLQALNFLDKFKGRVFICPGNHDFGVMGNFYEHDRAERFDEKLSVPLEQGGRFAGDNNPVVNIVSENGLKIMLIALDTNLETNHPFDFACGKVGERQLEGLDTILSNPATMSMPKIFFFHHHLFTHNNPFMELKDAYDLMRTIFGRVQVVLFGHKHVPNLWRNSGGIHYILAADNSPGKNFAREITVRGIDDIEVDDIRIA